ncbi:MAG: hypothetical protein WCH84_01225 [Verrucomicrobiota bacterium]
MDFIKKHLEKFLLAGALLVLIGVAGLLAWKVERLSVIVNAGLSSPTHKVPLKPTPTSVYSKAIGGFTNPTPWRISVVDPFHTGIEIVQPTLVQPQTVAPVRAPTQPFKLSAITRKPCRYVFKSYDKQVEKNFAINDSVSKRTFYVEKVGDKIWSKATPVYDTGFVVIKFEKKDTLVENPRTHAQRQQDDSELTIQRGTEPPLVLPLNRIIEEREPEAVLTCMADNQNQPVRKGQSVVCGGRIYNVVDITLRQVLIVDEQTKEKLTIIKE